ncbi:MAG: AEC family transporter, partial [Candidatus Kariarchaeaceae archaeon]
LIVPPFLAKIHKQDPPDPAEICTASFSNGLNFPFPIIYALSPDSLGIAGIFQAIAIIMRNTVGLWVSGVKINRKAIQDTLLFPPMWGIIIGITFQIVIDENTKQNITDSGLINIIFQIAIYATLMTLGFGLANPNLDFKHPLYRVGVTRFVVSSIVAVFIVYTFSLPKLIAIPIIVQMAAPPAVYNGLYAEKFGLNTELTSQVIVGLTFIALVVLPIELLLLQIMFGN